ncbi:unnamed protein product [Heligmosomoides polygyrus]|uniref:Golgi to ER traffic protein 4 homolog n=1 Tax=Heligmosomoides polygyrus TaxID=6339 RepID=A0A183GA42_HELPZ|nr:unnamed protein product [Heligmosomoides polygyrus]
MAQPSRLEKKAQDCIDKGEFYEAHQVYRTMYFRMVSQERYDDLLQILASGSKKLSEAKEPLSALDLAELYAETLLKSKCDPSESIYSQLYSMLNQFCDPNFPIPNQEFLNKFISTCVKWSQSVASKRRERKHGLSELHYVIARAYSSHGHYANARNHMLFADRPELLVMHRVHTASKLLSAYLAILNESPSCNGTRGELFNFLRLLCNALNFHDEKLFNHLVESYKPHLDVDPCYASYLDRISQIFFGSSSSKRKNDSFGGLFGNILKGVLGEKKEEEEIFSDSDFESGSPSAMRYQTEDAYETAEESDMPEVSTKDNDQRAAVIENCDDLD